MLNRISPSELNKPVPEREYISESIPYNDATYRKSSTPILWLDEYGDVRWNKAAEYGMIKYLTEKQFPNLESTRNGSFNKEEILKICKPSSIFILHQHWSGFFSRVLCFIAQFGQTLYSPRIAILRGSRFSGDRGNADDFLGQGILRYFLPISICSAYQFHPDMTNFKSNIESAANSIDVSNSKSLLKTAAMKVDKPLFSMEFWKPDYHHVPIRKWLFDRKKSSVAYDSPIEVLSDHSDEHIYAPKNEKNVRINAKWTDTNKPDAFSSELLAKTPDNQLTWQDYVFGSFLRYMFVLYFGSQNAPRIEYGVRVLAAYWSSYLIDKYSIPKDTNPFDDLASLYIRRGDKSNEDSFWGKHNRWRNLSYYVKGIVDEENRRKKPFKYVFVMTDDASVMSSLRDYANSDSKGTDEKYAREHLRKKEILFNVLAPQDCFDPFHRIGFEQFLVSMRFIIEHAAFNIGHTDSNVYRFLREVVYAQRQHQPNVQSFTYVQNAPDSLTESLNFTKLF